MDRDNPHDIFQQDGAVHSFDVVIRGYDRSQVHDVVDRLDGELRVALADKDASAARATELASHLASSQSELESLRQQAQSAAAPNFESMGARISHMLKLAEEEANDIRRIAQEDHTRSQAELKATTEKATRVRSEAEVLAQRMTEEAQEEARRLTEEAQDAAAAAIAQAQHQADELVERAHASADQAEVKSKARLAKLEEDFQLAQKARRAEAARVEQERDQASRRDAQNRIEQAQGKSDRMVAAAEKRVIDLDAQRAELHTRLTQIRELLGGLPEIGTATAVKPSDSSDTSTPAGPRGQARKSESDKASHSAEDAEANTDETKPALSGPTDVQGTRPPPPSRPSLTASPTTQSIPIPRQG